MRPSSVSNFSIPPHAALLPEPKGRLGRSSSGMDVGTRVDCTNPVCPRLRSPRAWLESLIRAAGQPMGPVSLASDATLTNNLPGQVGGDASGDTCWAPFLRSEAPYLGHADPISLIQ